MDKKASLRRMTSVTGTDMALGMSVPMLALHRAHSK